MANSSAVVPISTVDGPQFIMYPGAAGTVFLERLRPSGLRDGKSMFCFDVSALAAALLAASAPPPVQALVELTA